MPEYPEHEKLHAIADVSNEIGEFLDFGLAAQGIYLAEIDRGSWNHDRLVPCSKQIEHILARYFGIDQDKINAEKEQMLADIRAANVRSGHHAEVRAPSSGRGV